MRADDDYIDSVLGAPVICKVQQAEDTGRFHSHADLHIKMLEMHHGLNSALLWTGCCHLEYIDFLTFCPGRTTSVVVTPGVFGFDREHGWKVGQQITLAIPTTR